MNRREFIAFSASSMTLTALGIDIMLPAFAELRIHFGLPPESTTTSQIIAFFFMGQVAQIIFGTLSDSFGRLVTLRIGFPLYIIGGLAAAFAPGIELMLAARFVAGIGASAVFMTTIAGVRDRFVGDQMARTMSLVFTIFLFTPVIAPFLGMAILSAGSWQMVFLTPPVFAIIVFLWSLRMEESLPRDKRITLNVDSIRNAIGTVIGNRVFLRYTTITTVLFAGLSSYVSSSEHIVGEIYKKPELFTWIFAGMGLLMSLCSFMNSWLSSRFGARKAIKGLLSIYLITAIILAVCTLALGDPPPMPIFFVAVTIMMSFNLAAEPNSSALALEPLGNVAGIASSVYGTVFFAVGAILGSFVSRAMTGGVYPIVMSFLSIGVISVILAFTAPPGPPTPK